jgi:phospholipase A1
MKSLLSLALLLTCVHSLHGEGLLRTMIPPPSSIASGETVKVALVVFNPTTAAMQYSAPARLAGQLISGESSYAVELQAEQAGSSSIAPGAFARHRYAFPMPLEASGRVFLEVIDPDSTTLRTVFLSNPTTNALQAATEAPAAGVAPSGPAMASIDRSSWHRFGAHEAIYFVYGGDDPAAKFQLSFKYRLRGLGVGDDDQSFRALQFGYTQRSLWDINGNSSPFYDTSYMPSLFFESFAPPPAKANDRLTWLGYQAGFQHESNGGAGADSRSLNTLFFRRGLMYGSASQWHLIVSPKFAVYMGGLSDNPNLADYRGYAEWMVAIGKGNGATLTYAGRSGKSFEHFSTQLDLTIPVRIQFLDFETYFTLQYFNGYGESLRTYDQRTETLRVGLSLVRLR